MTGLRPILGVSLRPSNEARSPSPCVTCHILARTRLHRSTILSVLGPDHAFTVLFLGTHKRTSQWIHSPVRCGMLQFIPLRGPTSSSAHIRPGIGSDTNLSHPGPTPTTSRV
ncbi:unnamed protein product [Malus baccata var. baccata]